MNVVRSMLALRLELGFCLLPIVVGCGRHTANLPPPAAFENRPLAIVLYVDCPDGMRFHVSMNAAGDMRVLMEGRPNSGNTTVTLPGATQERLRHLVRDAQFFTLPSTIGRPGGDGTCIVVTVTLGRYAHSVTVHTSSLHLDGSERAEAQRIGVFCKGLVDCIRSHLRDGEVLDMPSLDESWFGGRSTSSEVNGDLPPEHGPQL